jgi:hypothetical protein
MLSMMRGRTRKRKKMGEKEQYNIHNRCYSELSYMKVRCNIFSENLYFEVSVGAWKWLNLTKKLV